MSDFYLFLLGKKQMLDWIMNIIGGDYNQKQIDALMPLVRDINHRYAEFDALSDAEIQAKTEEFKQRIENWTTLDDLLPEAFAVVKQACKRHSPSRKDRWNEDWRWKNARYSRSCVSECTCWEGSACCNGEWLPCFSW